jgi:MFS family permease
MVAPGVNRILRPPPGIRSTDSSGAATAVECGRRTGEAMAGRGYYGWWIVAGVFLVLTVSSGFGFYNLSVYINVLAAARGFSVAQVSVAVSLFFVVGGVTGMVVARLIEHHDVRWVMIGGAAVGGLALSAVGHAHALWQLYLLFTVFGIGNSAISIVTATTLVARWFPGSNRSVALSIASTGLSAGGIVVTPLSARLISQWGLESAIPWFGALFFLLVLPVALWIVRGHPPQAKAAAGGFATAPGWQYRDAIRSRFFVLVTLGYVLLMGSQVGAIAHLFNRAEQIADLRAAALAVQALSLMSIIGRVAGGWLVTRMPIRAFTLGNVLGQAAGLLTVATAEGPVQVIAGAALFGATVGNLLMLHPLWLVDAFGATAYSRIFSLSNAVSVLGVAAGPTLMGVLFDAFDYRSAYFTGMCASLLAFVLLVGAGRQPVARVRAGRDAPAARGPID